MTDENAPSDPVNQILVALAVAILVVMAAVFFVSGDLIPDQP